MIIYFISDDLWQFMVIRCLDIYVYPVLFFLVESPFSRRIFFFKERKKREKCLQSMTEAPMLARTSYFQYLTPDTKH